MPKLTFLTESLRSIPDIPFRHVKNFLNGDKRPIADGPN